EQEAAKESPYAYAYFVLNDEREKLYQRIDQRVDEMLREGLVDEVQKLADMGYTKNMVSMQGLGYKEILSYLDGTCSLEEAVYILKRDTRHFAKRQITWFKREPDVIWVNKPDFGYQDEKILAYMLENCEKRGILSWKK
ncbi:MAG: tRNA dimethylallyltransferase, partial [Blautia sp.]|nr:tRNA dimethylallyltransferase [Blautia sp.]